MSKPDDQSPGPPRPEQRRTQQIPRPADQRGGTPQSSKPTKKAVAPKNASARPSNAAGPPPAPAKKAPAKKAAEPNKPPMTAAEYSRTTTGSPASTAVIPAVKPTSPGPSAAKTRPEPAQPAPQVSHGRRASLRLVHVEPWSVTRLAFVVSVALMIVSVVAVSAFWIVLSMTGVWTQINDSVTSVLSDNSGSFDIKDYLGFGRVVGLTLVLSAINVILMTALATIGAHLYNLAAQLLGGLEVTFSDD